ncbi:MAG TPA: sigma-54 dependent transcriptional regulator, partial [Plasticicumulans sp.]
VLVVDDEPRSLQTITRVLEDEFDVLTATGSAEAERILAREWVQVILCDQRMPGETGVVFLARVREQWPDTVRIIVSGYTDAEDIIAGVNRAGIYQYLTKPWTPDALLLTVRGAVQLARLQRENETLALELKLTAPAVQQRLGARRRQLREQHAFARLVRAPGSPLDEVCTLAARIALYDIPLLIAGESGTGKELLARAVHYNSPRAERPFVVENCAALPDTLLESELFGHRKGAYTGAFEDRQGLFAQADGGTLFLDEIGEISPAFQVRLLRVLQEGEFRPVGSARTQRCDVRVIAATNRDLAAEVRAGRFREDLYYRLAGFVLEVPPLRARPDDIAPIAQALIADIAAAFGVRIDGCAPETLARLVRHDWPGNVRELRNELQRLIALADEPLLGPQQLSPGIGPGAAEAASGDDPAVAAGGTLVARLDRLERAILEETLNRLRWNKTRAADELGLSRVGLRAKLARHGLGPADD